MKWHKLPILPICFLAVFPLILSSCNTENPFSEIWPVASELPAEIIPTAIPLPPLPETLVEFRVQVPENTPLETTVYLTILDEVTGLALNPKVYSMQSVETSSEISPTRSSRIYSLSLPFGIGSVIKYRYEREAEGIRVGEHNSDGSPVRYRLFNVLNPGRVEDIVSRWTDTEFIGQTGRIAGQAIDKNSGKPIANLLIAAGGHQVYSKSDGSFLIEGLPPGVHNLVSYAIDGSYKTFQQGAQIAAESTTPTPLKISAAPLVKMLFLLRVPPDTPPVIPIRFAGNLSQLGNSFADLSGGMSIVPENTPVLNPLPDGRYSLTLTLPAGSDIHYKYTMGDGYWNAEHSADGEFKLRQIVVPEQSVLVEDTVETWYASDNHAPITFDVDTPANTPAEDYVSIQFNPIFGWTQPIPMWHLGDQRWAYILLSPLNIPGNLNYRYCRAGQCGVADDSATPGLFGQGRPLEIGKEAQTLQDTVDSWLYLDSGEIISPTLPLTTSVRAADFTSGIAFEPNFNPSWLDRIPIALSDIQEIGANWLILSPTWGFGRYPPGNNPPVLEPTSGIDPFWSDTLNISQQVKSKRFNLAMFPQPRFLVEPDEWWLTAQRDFSWWLVWYDQYRRFLLHHADLATEAGAQSLIIGGEWLKPSLPLGRVPDGSYSGVPADAEARWRSIIADIRKHFQGNLIWAIPQNELENPPPFLDSVDQVYLVYSKTEGEVFDESLEAQRLDTLAQTFQSQLGKPLVIALSYPSTPEVQTQMDRYNSWLNLVNQRPWISGLVSLDYYPPAILQDESASIHGKPTSELLHYWFQSLIGAQNP